MSLQSLDTTDGAAIDYLAQLQRISSAALANDFAASIKHEQHEHQEHQEQEQHQIIDRISQSGVIGQLPPTKIQRKYKCKHCNTLTYNPREHLRHRMEAHDEKVKIVECPECQYACQYRQKLNRHMDLVHRKQRQGVPSKVQARFKVEPNTNQTTTEKSIGYSDYFAPLSFYPCWLDPMHMMVATEPLDLSLPKETS